MDEDIRLELESIQELTPQRLEQSSDDSMLGFLTNTASLKICGFDQHVKGYCLLPRWRIQLVGRRSGQGTRIDS